MLLARNGDLNRFLLLSLLLLFFVLQDAGQGRRDENRYLHVPALNSTLILFESIRSSTLYIICSITMIFLAQKYTGHKSFGVIPDVSNAIQRLASSVFVLERSLRAHPNVH